MSNQLTKSARRVFDILELFRERQCPLRLKDVVELVGHADVERCCPAGRR